MENIKALFDLTKLPAKFFFLFAVISGFILFAADEILETIQLTILKEKYGWIVGLVFVLSAGLVIVNLVIWLYNYLDRKIRLKKIKKEFGESVKSLDQHEKAVIREFVINGQSSIEMPIDDPVITGLLQKNILKINKQFGNSFIMSGRFAPVSLNKYAEKVMESKDIDLSEKPTEDEIEFASNNRPKWTDKWGNYK